MNVFESSRLGYLINKNVDVRILSSSNLSKVSGTLIFGTKDEDSNEIIPVGTCDKDYQEDPSTGWYVVVESKGYAERLFRNPLCYIDGYKREIYSRSDFPSNRIQREDLRQAYGICNGGRE